MRPTLRSTLFGSAVIPLLVASGCSSTPEAAGTSADPIRDGVTDTTDRYAVFVHSANATSQTLNRVCQSLLGELGSRMPEVAEL